MAKKGKKKSKWAFRFDEMAELSEKLERMGGDLQKAVDTALKSTHEHITPQLSAGIARHNFSGDTAETLERAPHVEWVTPLKARVSIGFNLKEGGVPSIFLMWGTPKRRASKMPVDTSFRNAAFGPKVKREVAQLQREALEAAVEALTRG